MKVKTLLIAGLILVLMAGLLGSAGLAAAPPERIDVLIGFHEAPGGSEQALVRGGGGEIYRQFTLVNVVAARMTPQAAGALALNPRVVYVELDGPVYALEQVVPWGIDRVFGDETYPFATWVESKGLGINVAVLDTGIDQNHQDLNVVGGTNTIDGTHWGADGSGHGTHVAGTIAALDNAMGVVGVAPDVMLYAVKVLNDSGSGSASSVAAGIEWAVNNGIPVLNMSLGSRTHSQTLQDACDAAYSAGHLLVAAAGNSGNVRGRGDNVIYPAKYSSVVAVAASDVNNRRASFSSTGPAVELMAPGVSILSTLPGDKYGTYGGTSMASPHVAGVAALVWAAAPDLSNVEMRAILQRTAEDLGLPSSHQGYGLVRADLAVREVAEIEPPPPPEQYGLTISSTTGGSVTTPGEGAFTYDEGTVVDLVATPAAGYRFVNWTGDTGTVADVNAASTTIIMNGNYFITASFEEVVAEPAPVVYSVHPNSARRRDRLTVTIFGANLQNGAIVDFGERVIVQGVTFISPDELRVRIRVHNLAAIGPRDVTVTNPDGQSGMLMGGFTILQK
ncbi:MAG: peptidase S8 [Dehalococcoidia bacterium]|nr:MAG: peptidase S8 [Dehalococcoidia bacterium]